MSEPWRRSAVETADACLYRYRELYERGFLDEGDPARRGSAWHAAAAIYIELLFRRRASSDPALAAAALAEAFNVSGAPAYLYTEVAALFWTWAERFELDLDRFLLSEERQTDGGFDWRPDLVYAGDALDVHDFKTHWQVWTEAEARATLQARWYAWRASQAWPGFDRYRVTFEFVRYGVAVPVEFTPAELETIALQVEASVGRIRRARELDAWPATPGTHCGFCRLECPIVDEARRAPVRVRSADEAQRLAGELLALRQAAQARREALEAFAATDGAVSVNGVTWAHRPTEDFEFPIAEVLRVLEAYGETPAFTVSRSTLAKYLDTRKREHLRGPLLAVARRTVRTTFTAKQTTEEE